MKRSQQSSRTRRAWKIARKMAKEQGGSPRQYFGAGQKQAAAESKERSARQKRAWEIAKEMADGQGGSPRDYIGAAQHSAAEERKTGAAWTPASPEPAPEPEPPAPPEPTPDGIVVPSSMLPIVKYYNDLKGTDYPKSGSGTFWFINRGKGRAGQDDIDMAAALEDGDDIDVDTFYKDFEYIEQETNPGTHYEDSIKMYIYDDTYEQYILMGGDPAKLTRSE